MTRALCLGYAEATESYEATTGTGPLIFEGGGRYTLRAAPRNTGGITVRNADVNLGRDYWNPDPKTSTFGPVQVPESTDFNLENCGRVTAFCDQELAALRGEGTWGSIHLATNYAGIANLVVGSEASPPRTVFNGRLTGLGGLTKRGAGYRLVMTGANDYDGRTTVAEGALELRPNDSCRGGQGEQRYILANGTSWSSGRAWVRVYFNFSTNFNFTVGGYAWGNPSAEDGFAAPVGEAELYDGRWHQVAVTWDEGNVLSGYFDGRLLGRVTLAKDLNLPKNGVYNLSFNDANTRFAGEMDEVMLFRRALTASEIASDYARGRSVRETAAGLPTPVACWTFDDASAPGADTSGNGYALVAAQGTPSTIDTFPGTFGRSLSRQIHRGQTPVPRIECRGSPLASASEK